MKAAHQRGLPLFSTPFDTAAVDLLETLPVPAYKIASFEITDLRLCQKIAATGRPILLSTGMATLAEIDQAVAAIQHVWTSQQIQSELVLLKCVSAYPAPANDMNLRTIPHLAQAFGVKVGLSDHTLGTAVAVAAVALGAQVIEKHFTLRRSDGGPDSAFSAEPAELRCLADALREAHAALGQVRYGATSSDRANRLFRRSLFFSADVKAGSVITLDNVRVVRPGHGLSPHFLPLVLGRRLTCNCPRGTPVAWSHVGEGVGGAAQMASSTAADGDGMIG